MLTQPATLGDAKDLLDEITQAIDVGGTMDDLDGETWVLVGAMINFSTTMLDNYDPRDFKGWDTVLSNTGFRRYAALKDLYEKLYKSKLQQATP